MEELIKKMRIKYTVDTAKVAGIVLIILLSSFFTMIFGAVQMLSNNVLNHILAAPDSAIPKESLSTRCFVFYLDGDIARPFGIYSYEMYYYENRIEEIVNAAVNTENGKFKVGDLRFQVKTAEYNGLLVYGVYDRTTDSALLKSAAVICSFIFAIAVLLAALIAYMSSKITLSPVIESFKKQRDLIANASHELKTPLTVIATNLSVMKSEPDSTVRDNEKWIESIDTQIGRMNGLIKNMLELSKMENSAVRKEVVDFSKIVEGACLAFEAVSFEKGVDFTADISGGITVYGERGALERLVVILLDNAVKYCNVGGKIGCKLKSNKRDIYLSVVNTGECITKEDASHVFDRFYRSDGARQNPDGNSYGLGLAIAHATVVSHGGTITCHGVENKGTVFDVLLPAPSKKLLQTGNKELSGK